MLEISTFRKLFGHANETYETNYNETIYNPSRTDNKRTAPNFGQFFLLVTESSHILLGIFFLKKVIFLDNYLLKNHQIFINS